MPSHRLLIQHAAAIVLVCPDGATSVPGPAMGLVRVVVGGSIIVDREGLIVAVGTDDEIEKKYPRSEYKYEHVIDATGCSIVPGLCDGHTHPVWSGDRVNEFAMKLKGASYMDIHKAGGGIGYTVKCTRESSEPELRELLNHRVFRMLRQGTTLVEAKSGYGLELETEVKMLSVIHAVANDASIPVDLVANYLGAHSVPAGMTADEATRDIVDRQLPRIKELKDAGTISPELIDVFLEKGVFNAQQAREILEAGQAAGLRLNFHGDELNATGSAELGAELGALAISHLEEISDTGIQAMASQGTIAVLLPTTAYILKLTPPPARKMIDQGVAVALGSDFNPNAHCVSLPFVMNLACVLMKMTMEEALVAATINAAASMGRSATHGSIEVGKKGDFVIVSSPDWRHLIYELVDPPIREVIKNGHVVHRHEHY